MTMPPYGYIYKGNPAGAFVTTTTVYGSQALTFGEAINDSYNRGWCNVNNVFFTHAMGFDMKAVDYTIALGSLQFFMDFVRAPPNNTNAWFLTAMPLTVYFSGARVTSNMAV